MTAQIIRPTTMPTPFKLIKHKQMHNPQVKEKQPKKEKDEGFRTRDNTQIRENYSSTVIYTRAL
jgi:hypothetical protein